MGDSKAGFGRRVQWTWRAALANDLPQRRQASASAAEPGRKVVAHDDAAHALVRGSEERAGHRASVTAGLDEVVSPHLDTVTSAFPLRPSVSHGQVQDLPGSLVGYPVAMYPFFGPG